MGVARYTDILDAIDDTRRNDYRENPGPLASTGRKLYQILTTLPGTGYLKIAEGCDNYCSYCAIPYIRKYRSRGMASLVEEAKNLAGKGVKELVIIAQDITRYGQDLGENIDLVKLLKELCKICDIEWIRLLYCYPDRITAELLDLIAKEDKICKYLDIPIQHVNPVIIDRMNRSFCRLQAQELLDRIRKRIPDMVIRTTCIVGFPGEGQREFDELKEFVENYPLNHLGVFTYSREEELLQQLILIKLMRKPRQKDKTPCCLYSEEYLRDLTEALLIKF